MSKINIIYKIKNNDNIKSDKVRAIFLDGIITYNEENSIVKYNYNKNILHRETNDLILNYDFNEEKANIFIKELHSEMNPILQVINIDRKDNNIKIKYKLEEEIIEYELKELK
jgi:hypothetical protein